VFYDAASTHEAKTPAQFLHEQGWRLPSLRFDELSANGK
jgi:hypothetical protein